MTDKLTQIDRPKVKPLEWDVFGEAQTIFGKYKIGHCGLSPVPAVLCSVDPEIIGYFRTEVVAKLACQGHYEGRILSALDVRPVTVSEAAKVLLDECKRREGQVREYEDAVFASHHDFDSFCASLRLIAEEEGTS